MEDTAVATCSLGEKAIFEELLFREQLPAVIPGIQLGFYPRVALSHVLCRYIFLALLVIEEGGGDLRRAA
ncbi:MAG: hypothetical protein ABW148_14525 [Sedimenticola sp.]